MLSVSGHDPLLAYYGLIRSALGSPTAVYDTLNAMTPIVFTGLSAALLFKSSLFWIGQEGQLYVGALLAFLTGYLIRAPPGIHAILALLAGGLGGLLWCIIPGYLRSYHKVNETVTSIMMIWIAVYLTDYFVEYAFADPKATIARTFKVNESALIPSLPNPEVNLTFLLAISSSILVGLLLYSSTLGYEIRCVGYNPVASRVARINVERTYFKSFMISGFLAGLSGASMVLGVFGSVVYRFSPGYGWDGITAALIAKNNPFMVVPASLLLAVLRTGSIGMMVTAGVSNELVLVIQGVILVVASMPEAYRMLKRKLGGGGW